MKNLNRTLAAVALAFSLGAPALAQNNADAELPPTRFGIKGGLNLSNLWQNDQLDDNMVKPGLQAGVFVRVPFGWVFSLQPELMYTNLGSKLGYNNSLQGSRSGTLSLNYVQLPVLLKINPTPIFGLHLGPYAGYLVNANVSNEQLNVVNTGEDTELNTDAFNTIDYGAAAGIELNFRFIDIGARYNLGLREVGRAASAQRFTGNGYNQNVALYVAFVL